MSRFDDFSQGEIRQAVLKQIRYFGADSNWSWGRNSYLGLFKFSDDSIVLAAAIPNVSLADQELEILGIVRSDYDADFLENNWISMAGWRIGTNGHDTAEGYRVIYSNGDANGYGDKYWLQTFEFDEFNHNNSSRAIENPRPLDSAALSRLEQLHETDINGDGKIGDGKIASEDFSSSVDFPQLPDARENPIDTFNSGSSDITALIQAALADAKSEMSAQPINITVVNNTTTNTTNSNINNTGDGNISVGDIGTVNNIVNIDNSFSIQNIINIDLSEGITGDSKKNEIVNGTSGDDLIVAGAGRDELVGAEGADNFYFPGDEPFKKKLADEIVDFDAGEGDAVVIAEDLISNPAITDEVIEALEETEIEEIPVASTPKELKNLSEEGHSFIYDKSEGELLMDANGSSPGIVDTSADPVLLDLEESTPLTNDLLEGIIDDIGDGNNASNPIIDEEIIEALEVAEVSEIPVAESPKELKKLSKEGHTLIYDQSEGDLLIDANGAEKGFVEYPDPVVATVGESTELTDELIGAVVEDLEAGPSLAVAENKKELKSLAKENHDIIYFEPKGEIFIDGNGDSPGFGKKTEGGLIANLPDETSLTESDVLIGV